MLVAFGAATATDKPRQIEFEVVGQQSPAVARAQNTPRSYTRGTHGAAATARPKYPAALPSRTTALCLYACARGVSPEGIRFAPLTFFIF